MSQQGFVSNEGVGPSDAAITPATAKEHGFSRAALYRAAERGALERIASDQLARYRHALDDEDTGRELQRIVDDLRTAGFSVDGDRLKTRPRGAAPDHPFLDLLRHRTLTVARPYGELTWLPTPGLLDRVATDWGAYRLLIDWLTQHVGSART